MPSVVREEHPACQSLQALARRDERRAAERRERAAEVKLLGEPLISAPRRVRRAVSSSCVATSWLPAAPRASAPRPATPAARQAHQNVAPERADDHSSSLSVADQLGQPLVVKPRRRRSGLVVERAARQLDHFAPPSDGAAFGPLTMDHAHSALTHFRENSDDLFMAPSSQRLEPPGKPGRFDRMAWPRSILSMRP